MTQPSAWSSYSVWQEEPTVDENHRCHMVENRGLKQLIRKLEPRRDRRNHRVKQLQLLLNSYWYFYIKFPGKTQHQATLVLTSDSCYYCYYWTGQFVINGSGSVEKGSWNQRNCPTLAIKESAALNGFTFQTRNLDLPFMFKKKILV